MTRLALLLEDRRDVLRERGRGGALPCRDRPGETEQADRYRNPGSRPPLETVCTAISSSFRRTGNRAMRASRANRMPNWAIAARPGSGKSSSEHRRGTRRNSTAQDRRESGTGARFPSRPRVDVPVHRTSIAHSSLYAGRRGHFAADRGVAEASGAFPIAIDLVTRGTRVGERFRQLNHPVAILRPRGFEHVLAPPSGSPSAVFL